MHSFHLRREWLTHLTVHNTQRRLLLGDGPLRDVLRLLFSVLRLRAKHAAIALPLLRRSALSILPSGLRRAFDRHQPRGEEFLLSLGRSWDVFPKVFVTSAATPATLRRRPVQQRRSFSSLVLSVWFPGGVCRRRQRAARLHSRDGFGERRVLVPHELLRALRRCAPTPAAPAAAAAHPIHPVFSRQSETVCPLKFTAGYRRFQIRQRFGIAGTECGDYAAWLCCPTLALCQETRTLAANNVEDGVWVGAAAQASPMLMARSSVGGYPAAGGYTPAPLHAFGQPAGGGLYSPAPSAPPPFAPLPAEQGLGAGGGGSGHGLHLRPGIAVTESNAAGAGSFYIPRKQ